MSFELPHDTYDLAIKAIARAAPWVFFQVAGLPADPDSIRHDDTGVTIKELRADGVFLHAGSDTEPPFGLCLEYVWQWDPDRMVRSVAGRTNGHWFETVCLWEFADRIRLGELPELAPFLILWEHEDVEGTLREEREVIQTANLPEPIRQEVLATAYLLGLRYASRRIVDAVFREEVMKLEEMGLIGERIAARISEQLAEADAKGRAAGLERGLEQGLERGRGEQARTMAKRVLQRRFGELPEVWLQRIEATNAEGCLELVERALEAETLDELVRDSE